MKLLTVDTIDKALEKINNFTKAWSVKTEIVSLDNALGKILAEDIYAPCDVPPFRRSTVDGYALIASNIAGAKENAPVTLRQTNTVLIGKNADFSIQNGECAYVPTGGMMPNGADAMVMVEYCEVNNNNVLVNSAAAPGANIVEIGEDLQKEKLFLERGIFIRPQEIGALAAAGITKICVYIPKTLSLISSGDELVAPEKEPLFGEIRDVNTSMINSLAKKHGYNILSSQVIPDDEALLESAVKELMACSDIIIISGGSSQGEKDFTSLIIDKVSKPGVFIHGLALKPGKPTILGWDEESKTLFVGLPGHPVSAMMVFELLLGKYLPCSHSSCAKTFPVPARISCNVKGEPGRSVYLPVSLKLKDSCYYANPVFGKSGIITTLTRADGYVIIDLNKEGLEKDEPVFVHLF
jgi:molybdopterin molybdotransferase